MNVERPCCGTMKGSPHRSTCCLPAFREHVIRRTKNGITVFICKRGFFRVEGPTEDAEREAWNYFGLYYSDGDYDYDD